MSNVKLLIVEDEIIIAEMISSQLKKAGYSVTDLVSSGEEAILSVKYQVPDLIIMDIHLDGKLDGIDTAAQIKKELPVPVIFITDADDKKTAARAQAVGASAYLIKPFHEKQIMVSIHQALHNSSHNHIAAPDETDAHTEENYILNNCLFIKKERESAFKKVPFDTILYIEADRAYCIIHTADSKYTHSSSMSQVHKRINNPSFVQVHRSHLVNLDKVDGVKGNLLLIGDVEIVVGETYKEDVMKRFPMLK